MIRDISCQDFTPRLCRINLPEEESIEMIKDFIQKSYKINLDQKESVEKFENFVPKSLTCLQCNFAFADPFPEVLLSCK